MRRAFLFQLPLAIFQLGVARFDFALQLSNSLELLLNLLVEVAFVLLLSLHMRFELLLDCGDLRVPLRESLGHRTFDVISLDSNLFALLSSLSDLGLPLGELLIALGKGIDQLRPDLVEALPQLPDGCVAFLDRLIERLFLPLEFERGNAELMINPRLFRGAGLQLF